jgi:hypothetical protein
VGCLAQVVYNVGCLVQASLGLRSDRCRELWRVYDTAQADLRPLLERNLVLEQQLDTLLAMHDISSDGSYHAIFQAGKPPTFDFFLVENPRELRVLYLLTTS